MTVIVYRDGVMAADTLVVDAANAMYHTQKIFRMDDGGLIATAGGGQETIAFRNYFLYGIEADDLEYKDFSGILVKPDGLVYYCETHKLIDPVDDDFIAIGSGRMIANGALEMGASAEEAVKIACKYNIYCGEPISILRLNDGKS